MTSQTQFAVPLLDLNPQYKDIEDKLIEAFKSILDSKQFILGPAVQQLESDIAKYTQTKHAIGVSSGSDALIISLMGLDIGPGDEVITTPFTFFATAGSIARVGATPVFVDIEPDTFNINPALIESKITKKTKAIMPVHLFGQLADMTAIMAIAKKHQLHVIEDAAQAIGASATNTEGQLRPAGSVGDCGCFSFFPSKNLGCLGDAGIVVTNNDVLAEKLRFLRNHGATGQYQHQFIGGNFRIDTLQAAFISIKLPLLNIQHQQRIKNAHYYNAELPDTIQKPVIASQNRSIYNQYTLRLKNRDHAQAELKKNTIGNAIYYPIPLHLQACFSYLNYKESDFPESERAAKEVLSIPVFGGLHREQLDKVVQVLSRTLS